MIKAQMGQHDLFPTFDFEEADLLAAQNLKPETEILLKEKIYEVMVGVVDTEFAGTPEEVLDQIKAVSFQKGRMAAFKELLEDSKNAKAQLNLL